MCTVPTSNSPNQHIASPIESLLVFSGQLQVNEEGTLVNAEGQSVGPESALQELVLGVGEECKLTVVGVGLDGSYRILSEMDKDSRLRVKSSDYSVWAQRRPYWAVLGREQREEPVKVSFAFGVGFLGISLKTRTEIKVTVTRGHSFVAFEDEALEGIPLAFWQYGREHVSVPWRRRPYQYIIGSSLGIHAKRSLGKVSYAYCDSLSRGWQTVALERVKSSDEKALVCDLDSSGEHFALNCRRKGGSLTAEALDKDGALHELTVKVLPESLEDKWQGVWESPLFRSRTRLRVRWWTRLIGCSVCMVFLVVWLWGCWQAQVVQRGLGPGTWYTLGQFGLALFLVVALTAVAFIFNALMFGLSRKLKR